MTDFNQKIKIIINKYSTDDVNKSKTLNILKICGSRMTTTIQQQFTQEIFLKLIEDNITYEIQKYNEGYHVFYTSQNIHRYIVSRFIDYLLFNKKGIPKQYLLNSKILMDNLDKTEPGLYDNIFDYLEFFFKELDTQIQSTKVDYIQLFELQNITEDEFKTNKEKILNDLKLYNLNIIADTKEDLLNKIKNAPFSPTESYDNRNSKINPNVLSVNNTLVGNSFSEDTSGESTLKFILTNYKSTDPRLDILKKWLKSEIDNLKKILVNVPDIVNLDDIDEDFVNIIRSVDTNFKSSLLYRICIKFNSIPDHYILTNAYALPVCNNIKFSEEYKNQLIEFIKTNDYTKKQDIIKKMIECNNNELSDTEKKIKSFSEIIKNNTGCNLFQTIQGRIIITKKWIEDINNENIVVNIYPCNYDNVQDKPINCQCITLGVNILINNLIKKLGNPTIQDSYVKKNADIFKQKYLKYKMKYLQIKQQIK
jgi:hypothetical protein